MTRIVLAYPDAHPSEADTIGHDAIAWLAEQYSAEIVTLMLDFGHGRELEALRDRALAAGAVRAHVLDVADEFAARFVLPALKAGALYPDDRPSAPALVRMVMAQKLVSVAAIEHTSTVAHAYDGSVPVGAAIQALDPNLTVTAVPQSIGGGDSAGVAVDPGPTSASSRRSEAAFVDLTFVRGAPTAINGVTMPLTDLIGSIDMLSGVPGGRLNYRATAAARVLHDAHRGLQESVASSQSDRQELGRRYAELITTGAWFSPDRQSLDTAIERLEKRVSGTVRLELLNNECRIVDIKSLEAQRKEKGKT